MKYKRCKLCETNYVEKDNEICKICQRHSFDFGEEMDEDICPYCEKNVLEYGEEKCKSCKLKSVAKAGENG